jgi:hypothetical protein
MIPRRRGERTQKGNPHRLTREQHVIPAATLRRFALPDGRVEVHLRDGRIVKLPVGDRLFCVERLWDQRSEVGYMKRIEDEFQALVTDLEAGHPGSLTDAEHRCVTRFWGLWHWRNHFIDAPLEDVKLNSVAGESMSLDKREILESNGYAFAVADGKMPARMMVGLPISHSSNLAIWLIGTIPLLRGFLNGILSQTTMETAFGVRPSGLSRPTLNRPPNPV